MNRLDGLHPKVRTLAEKLVETAKTRDFDIIVTQGLRTSAEQDALYAKGRTVPGEPCRHAGKFFPLGSCKVHPFGLVVTNAKGGQSYHNFGLAFDIGLLKDGKLTYDPGLDLDHSGTWDYIDIGPIGESLGLEWGGRWKFQDVAHFQMTFGLSLEDLRNGKEIPS